MFNEVKPFDWLMFAIAALTLLLLVYQIVSDQRRRKLESQTHGWLEEKTVSLSMLLDKGRRLQKTVIDEAITTDHRSVNAWVEAVNDWIIQTRASLSEQPRALDAFTATADTKNVVTFTNFTERGFYVTGISEMPYRKLAIHLENLQRIIDIPDAYLSNPTR